MAYNRGKAFEDKFKADFTKSLGPEATIDRLYDSTSGWRISNISDFIAYFYPYIFYIECKSKEGNTFPFSNLTQYEDLLVKVGKKGVRAGVVIWFIDHDKVIYVPISSITKMKEDGKKSINIRTIDEDGYKYFNVPSTKKRVFLDSNYCILMETEEGD